MATNRRQLLLLTALLVALAVIGYRAWSDTSATAGGTSNRQGALGSAASGRRPSGGATSAPDVHLDSLDAERPHPNRADRNLFRFKPKPAPAPPTSKAPAAAVAVAPTGPPPVPPPPPIALKCIGVLDRGQGQKIAILTDGVGPPMYAAEGQPIAGRYRLLHIGAESIEMAYLDGRGRVTIRISGS